MGLHRLLFILSKKYRDNKIVRKLVLPFWKRAYKVRRNKSIKAFRIHGEESIQMIYQNLNSKETPIWLEFGTLLGAYRNNDFIKNDIDIDLGAFLKDERKIDVYLKNLDFKLVREFKLDSGTKGLERTYSYKGVFIDVFYFLKDNDLIYTYGFERKNCIDGKYVAVRYEFKDSGFKSSSFKNMKVYIPDDAKNHLMSQYGEDFMIPDPHYSDKNAPNRKEITPEYDVTYEEFY